MDEHVRICHFRNHYELTRKNYMVKNLKRFRKQLERDGGKLEAAKCDFFPKTFEMPCEYHLFVEEFRKNPGITWIMKPVARSQGKGIFLFRRLKDIVDWRKGTACKKFQGFEAQPSRYSINSSGSHDPRNSDDQRDEIPVENYVAQRYIENPYLIGGRKFDLRVYVLVMSVSHQGRGQGAGLRAAWKDGVESRGDVSAALAEEVERKRGRFQVEDPKAPTLEVCRVPAGTRVTSAPAPASVHPAAGLALPRRLRPVLQHPLHAEQHRRPVYPGSQQPPPTAWGPTQGPAPAPLHPIDVCWVPGGAGGTSVNRHRTGAGLSIGASRAGGDGRERRRAAQSRLLCLRQASQGLLSKLSPLPGPVSI
ncbi:Hypothetical predicted protein [Marmota monax]|uniref:Tubulin--tyrosine ligase-like protein 9 n=1 Tax=Marmota monax TaxID=9995 RepID=A0A5E4CT83_MARMO|nr:Hypothetical predicted protein [Marmota monax]